MGDHGVVQARALIDSSADIHPFPEVRVKFLESKLSGFHIRTSLVEGSHFVCVVKRRSVPVMPKSVP